MKHLATLLLLLLAVPVTFAQDQLPTPTVRQINALPQSSIDALNAEGASLTAARLSELVQTSPFARQEVEITVVLLTTPRTSGLSSFGKDLDGDGTATRPTASTSSPATPARPPTARAATTSRSSTATSTTTGLLSTQRGDVVTIRGTVDYFNETLQFTPANEAGSVVFEGLPRRLRLRRQPARPDHGYA